MTDHRPAPLNHRDERPNPYSVTGARRPWLVYAIEPPGGGLSPSLADLVLDSYSSTGDIVIDLDNDPVFAEEAARKGRLHHAVGGTDGLPALRHAAGYIDLLLGRWPRPPVNPQRMLTTCRALLLHAGHLVLVLSGDRSRRVMILTALAGAAGTAELTIVDHLVVVGTEPHDGETGPVSVGTVAWRAHTDVLVFTVEPAPRLDPARGGSIEDGLDRTVSGDRA